MVSSYISRSKQNSTYVYLLAFIRLTVVMKNKKALILSVSYKFRKNAEPGPRWVRELESSSFVSQHIDEV
jgi:hypothetical protein